MNKKISAQRKAKPDTPPSKKIIILRIIIGVLLAVIFIGFVLLTYIMSGLSTSSIHK